MNRRTTARIGVVLCIGILGCAMAWGRAGLPSHNPSITPYNGSSPVYVNFTPGVCTGANPQSVVNVPIGAAAADRIVVVAMNVQNTGGLLRVISAASIGGISATIDIQSAANPNVALIHAAVPTGTTATVQFDVGGSASVCDIWSYALYGFASATPDSTNRTGGTATSLTTTLNYVAGGVGIGVYTSQGNSGTVTWTGLTVDDARLNSSTRTESAAHRASVTGQTGASVTVGISGSAAASSLAVGSWH